MTDPPGGHVQAVELLMPILTRKLKSTKLNKLQKNVVGGENLAVRLSLAHPLLRTEFGWSLLATA